MGGQTAVPMGGTGGATTPAPGAGGLFGGGTAPQTPLGGTPIGGTPNTQFANQLGLYGQGAGQPAPLQTQAQLPTPAQIMPLQGGSGPSPLNPQPAPQSLQSLQGLSPEQQQQLQQFQQATQQRMQNDPMLQFQNSAQGQQYRQQEMALQNQLQGLPEYQQMEALGRQFGTGMPTPEQQQQMQQLQQQLQSSPVYSQMRALNQQQQDAFRQFSPNPRGMAPNPIQGRRPSLPPQFSQGLGALAQNMRNRIR